MDSEVGRPHLAQTWRNAKIASHMQNDSRML